MLAVDPNCEEKGVGKAIIVQRLYMLLEQTTDNRDREESERSAAYFGGFGAGLSVAGRVPLPNGKTEMKRLMSTMSGVLGQVAYEMRIYGEDISRFERWQRWVGRWGASKSVVLGIFVYAAVGEVLGEIEEGGGAVEDDLRGGTVPKKICGGAAVGWYVPEEFPGCELYDFLHCNTVLFEGEQQQLPMKEKEDFLTISLRMCRMCINIVLEGELGKKIKLFLGE